MANLMHRLLRNQSCLRAIPRITPGLLNHQKSCISEVESVSVDFDPVPLTNPVITVASEKSLRFFPSFPIGYGFNPTVIHDSSLIKTVPFMDAVVEEKDEKEIVIYADSVKKKRKKKMNKHKYRKLRKRLGRKS